MTVQSYNLYKDGKIYLSGVVPPVSLDALDGGSTASWSLTLVDAEGNESLPAVLEHTLSRERWVSRGFVEVDGSCYSKFKGTQGFTLESSIGDDDELNAGFITCTWSFQTDGGVFRFRYKAFQNMESAWCVIYPIPTYFPVLFATPEPVGISLINDGEWHEVVPWPTLVLPKITYLNSGHPYDWKGAAVKITLYSFADLEVAGKGLIQVGEIS